jgi:DUF971 family protein
MSFWDTLKPAVKAATATAVELGADQQTLSLRWNDGTSSEVSARLLRQHCPCAECVEEWSGKRTFEVDSIPKEMKIVEVAPVGNYALTFTFGDLHRTGIYKWDYLKALSHGQIPA